MHHVKAKTGMWHAGSNVLLLPIAQHWCLLSLQKMMLSEVNQHITAVLQQLQQTC